MNPFGTAFSLIKASDLIRVSEEGKVIEGGENRLLNAAAFAIVCVPLILLVQLTTCNTRIMAEHTHQSHSVAWLDID